MLRLCPLLTAAALLAACGNDGNGGDEAADDQGDGTTTSEVGTLMPTMSATTPMTDSAETTASVDESGVSTPPMGECNLWEPETCRRRPQVHAVFGGGRSDPG